MHTWEEVAPLEVSPVKKSSSGLVDFFPSDVTESEWPMTCSDFNDVYVHVYICVYGEVSCVRV